MMHPHTDTAMAGYGGSTLCTLAIEVADPRANWSTSRSAATSRGPRAAPPGVNRARPASHTRRLRCIGVGALPDNGLMTQDAHPHHVVQKPRKRAEPVTVGDLTMLVRVPGRPHESRPFTAAEEAEAHQYAADTGGDVVPLPLAPPSGYTVGADGNLVPTLPTASSGMNAGLDR